MILGDDFALHRHPATGEPLPGKPTWTTWDYNLVAAFQLVEDFTDRNGLLAWEKDHEDVLVEPVAKIDPYEKALAARTGGKNYKPRPGETFMARATLQPWAEEWPTFREWVEEQNKND